MTPASVRKSILEMLQKYATKHVVKEGAGVIVIYDPLYPDNLYHAVAISFHQADPFLRAKAKRAARTPPRKTASKARRIRK
ncbi:hypothetical protein P3C58_18870 [Mesorhizobium sp. XAP10]|uniref:hypothetical protein n=1 Tax=unclassified Mesorhizobium TaxID=325217 RepID=UPI0023DE72DB|nr:MULTISPECIES: hypothetical protein [unclassified Mesorhizobium]MDF3154045.1 hypothetical protein [Mesorhizobium sp. XAP10]MDF3247186.1 hypothetical protein [Mesorhizobium sp. XAP4]